MSEEPTPIVWHYAIGGNKHGPVTEADISFLLDRGKLDGETVEVWRSGMQAWKPIRESELAHLVAATPPPISAGLVSNTLVWIVAIIPLVVGLIDAALAMDPATVLARALGTHGGLPFQEPETPFALPGLLTAALCFWDERRLNKAGYSSKWMTAFAFLLAPVYLFMRAKRLKQRPTYAICWLVLVIVAAILVGAARSN